MKKSYYFKLVQKDLRLPFLTIPFYGTAYQANKAFYSLSFALSSSPFSDLMLFSGNSLISHTFLPGSYVW